MSTVPSPRPAPGQDELPDLLDEGLTLFATQVRAIAPDEWDRPTPCADWTVRDLVGHVVSTMEAGALIVGDEEIPPRPPRPGDAIPTTDPDEVADRVDTLARGFRSALSGADLTAERDTPMGRRTVAEGLGFPIVDLAIHAWDLSTALGRPVELPTPLLRFADTFSRSVPESLLRNPRTFGPATEPPAEASPTETLMAFLGREITPHQTSATGS